MPEFSPPWVTMPALDPRGSQAWLDALRPAIAGALGRTPAVLGVPYGTDAGPLGHAGIPAVVLGPGDIAQAHTKDEWVDLDEVRAAVDVYYRIACALG
jgi:acetylornithine deacetylase